MAIRILTVTGGEQTDDGVKVYGVEPITDVFIVDGFHIPATPSLEVAGRDVGVAFWQNGPIGSKVGVTDVLTVTVLVAEPLHGAVPKLYVTV